MKKTLIWYMLAFFASRVVLAQQPNFQSLSLDDAIQYALANHPKIANAQIDQQLAKAKVGEAKAALLPQIQAGAELAYYPSLQKTFFQPNLFLPNTTDTNVAVGSLQVPLSGNVQVSATQTIWNTAYWVGKEAASLYTELATKNEQQTAHEIRLAVSKAYYTVLVNQERLVLIDANIQRLTEAQKDTEAALQNGIAEKLDLDKIVVMLNNAKIEKDKFLQINDLGIALLKFQMNLPQEQPITITTQLKDFIQNISVTNHSEEASSLSIEILGVQKQLQILAIKNIRAHYLPSAHLFGQWGTNTGANTLGSWLMPTNWYNFSAIGLRIQAPIFDGLQKKYQLQQKKLELQKMDNQAKMLNNTIQLQQKQAAVALKNALLSLQMHEQNIKLATEVLRIAKIKYKEGTNSNLDLLNAATALKEATANYQQTLYELLLADLELKLHKNQ